MNINPPCDIYCLIWETHILSIGLLNMRKFCENRRLVFHMYTCALKLRDILTVKNALVMSGYCVTECNVSIPVAPSNNQASYTQPRILLLEYEPWLILDKRSHDVTDRFWRIVNGTEQFWAVLSRAEQCCAVLLKSAGLCYWTVVGCATEQYWAVLLIIAGLCYWTLLDCVTEQCWAVLLNNAGPLLNSTGPCYW
jgi:hypothetical protein